MRLVKIAQTVGDGVNELLVNAQVEHGAGEPVVGAGKDLLVEPVVPETAIDHICQETGDGHVGVQDHSRINLIHVPLSFKSREDKTERLFERVLLTVFQRLAPVDQPGDINCQQCQTSERSAPTGKPPQETANQPAATSLSPVDGMPQPSSSGY